MFIHFGKWCTIPWNNSPREYWWLCIYENISTVMPNEAHWRAYVDKAAIEWQLLITISGPKILTRSNLFACSTMMIENHLFDIMRQWDEIDISHWPCTRALWKWWREWWQKLIVDYDRRRNSKYSTIIRFSHCQSELYIKSSTFLINKMKAAILSFDWYCSIESRWCEAKVLKRKALNRPPYNQCHAWNIVVERCFSGTYFATQNDTNEPWRIILYSYENLKYSLTIKATVECKMQHLVLTLIIMQ